jgi:hypothetical protein
MGYFPQVTAQIQPPAPEYPPMPAPGTPEFLALVDEYKDHVEELTGIRPDVVLDVDPLDDFHRNHRPRG